MKTLTILVTGGIGSGKSAVCAHYSSLGIPVYDSDSRAKALYGKSLRLAANVNAAFGGDLLSEDGVLDRAKLAERAFASDEALRRLEALVHPAVLEDFRDWREAAGSEVVILESAIASSLPSFMSEVDRVLLVCADERTRIRRAMLRDGCDEQALAQRIRRQEEKLSAALRAPDAVIQNDASLEELYAQADRALRELVKGHGGI